MLKKILSVVFCLSLFLLPVMAEESESANYVEVGVHGNNTSENTNKAAEYANTEKEVEGALKLRYLNEVDDMNYKLEMDFFNSDEMKFNFTLYKGGWFKSTTTYNKFLHKYQHDTMDNLQFRESVDENYSVPGGKFVSHEDYDPTAEYGITVEEFKQIFNFVFNTEIPTDLEVGFRALKREGHKQSFSLAHCDNCHIESKTAVVDEMTTDVWVKLHATVGKTNVAYTFTSSNFNNSADIMQRYYDLAMHPTKGTFIDEFGSRDIYTGEELPYGYNNDNKVTTHKVKALGDVSGSSKIVASAVYSETENKAYNLKMKSTSGSFRWTYKAKAKKMVTDVFLSTYKLDNDDYFVDLPTWRDGRTGGGQDFDFLRQSTYNRTVYFGKVRTTLLNDAGRFTFSYRYKNIDREYEQLTYEGNVTESESHLFDVKWRKRFKDVKLFANVSYEDTNHPYANRNGILEQEMPFTPLDASGKTYYFQRIRTGEATNMPSSDFKARFNLSTKLAGSSYLTLSASYRDAKNDTLNSYVWDMDATNVDLSIYTMLGDKSAVSFGYDYNNMTSAALFSTPVFDG
jgi:hypothetical protein